MFKKIAITVLPAAMALAGCGQDSPVAPAPGDEAPVAGVERVDDTQAVPPAGVTALASAALDKGGQVDFFLVDDVAIVVSVAGPPADRQILPTDERLEPVELFSRLLPGRPVPPALLRAAQDRRDRMLAAGSADPGADDSGRFGDPAVATRPQATAAKSGCDYDTWFVSNMCGSWDFDYCYTCITGNYTIEEKAWYFRSAACPYRGSITMTVQYRNMWGTWKNLTSRTVSEDHYREYCVYWLDKKWHRVSIGNASGDGYHLSCYGAR